MKLQTLILMVLVLTACNEIAVETGRVNELPKEGVNVTYARCIIPPIEESEASKSSLALSGSSLKFSWADGDVIGVYPTATGSGISFAIKDGIGTNSATFDGAGWSFIPGQKYVAISPFNVNYLVNDNPYFAIPCSYEGQVPGGNDDVGHLGTYDYLTACETLDGNNDEVVLHFKHASAFMHLNLTHAGLFTGDIKMIPMYNTIPVGIALNIEDNSYAVYKSWPEYKVHMTETDSPLSVYLAMAGKDYSEDYWGLIVLDSAGNIYGRRIKGPNLKKGKLTHLSCDPLPYVIDEDSDIQVCRIVQNSLTDLGVKSGSHSGITFVSGTRVALVDDASKGCGIYYLDYSLNEETLEVTSATKTIAPGIASDKNDRDPEGIAYNGATIFTSGENQTILEYDMNGVATGRSLHIPSDMAKDNITSNKGFEALSYNAVTGKYWTVTESTLNSDLGIMSKHLLRLQSFDDNTLEPLDRYLYLMDAPLSPTTVYGMPDMAALDDGRIIVMERERSIPNYILNGWVRLKLYLIDPIHDEGAILSKHLITDIMTKTTSVEDNYVANYEGMCIGPHLSNGHQTILLVNDSNGGLTSGSLKVKDFLTVIEVDGI